MSDKYGKLGDMPISDETRESIRKAIGEMEKGIGKDQELLDDADKLLKESVANMTDLLALNKRLRGENATLRATVERQAGEIERLQLKCAGHRDEIRFLTGQRCGREYELIKPEALRDLRAAKEASEAERDRFSDCWQQREHDCFILQTERDALRARVAELEGSHEAK